MKLITVVGARPQFIKASVVSRALAVRGLREILVHTGQHFDDAMSAVFFRELDLPEPAHFLGICGGTHGEMTGRMLVALDALFAEERPSAVLVYGDTNTTLAAAVAAVKLHIPVIHVESGLRSFRKTMPEEINRVVTDHVSTVLCCPTTTAVDNLRREGFSNVVHDGALLPLDADLPPGTGAAQVVNVGDVMLDVLLQHSTAAAEASTILEQLRVSARGYVVLTIHRAENTESTDRLRALLETVFELAAEWPVVFPVHPRTAQVLQLSSAGDILRRPGVIVVEPLPYLDFLQLQANALAILTDSGGVQKEAFFLRVPCITLRGETEWPETVLAGANVIAGSNPTGLGAIVRRIQPPAENARALFGDGCAAARIARLADATCR